MLLNLSQQLESVSLLKKFLKLIGSLVFAIFVFGFILLFTPQGSRIALHLLSDLTPYQLRFNALSGTLAKHLELKEVTLIGPKLQLKAAELEINWHFIDFFKSKKKLQSLKAKKLELWYEGENTLSSHEPSLDEIQASLKNILPFALFIEHLAIQDMHFHWNEIDHQLSELTIKGASNRLSEIEEIHYKGTFGSINVYLQGEMIVNWDLLLTKNPYVVQLHTSPIMTTGSILLPSRHLEDPQNQIQINIKTKALTQGSHRFENINLDVKGTLAKHHVYFKGLCDKLPLETEMDGQFSQHAWQGKIKKLRIKEEKLQKIGNTTGVANFNWKNKTISSNLRLLLDQKYPIDIQASINKIAPYDLNGRLNTQISNVKDLSYLIPSLSNLKGKLAIDLTLGGTLFNPKWTGEALLTDAKLRATALSKNAFLNDLRLTLFANHKIDIKGKGSWGSGTFMLLGKGDLNTQSPTFEIAFKGDQLLLSDTPEYYIIANPDLKLTLQNKLISLSGKIFIPQAEIQSLKSPDMISPSDDVVIVSDKKKQSNKPSEPALTHIATHIELILGNSIIYKGHGLSTNIDGRIFVNQQPGQPPNANGKLILKNGKYKAYGKVFDIHSGQIFFTGGPIYDPLIEIKAQRIIQPETTFGTFAQTQPIVAGIMLSGNFKSPKISFYSTPSMADGDIISYLVVGRPQNKVNEAQAELLFQAVSELTNIMGGSRKDVHFDLAEKLKLDQLGFAKKPNYIPSPGSHNPLEDTVFVLGKQLSDRLYLNYSVGLADSASQIGMRYALGKNLMIEASTGSQGSSADLLLSLEGN